MFEGKRVVAGEAILSGVATTDRSASDRSKVEQGESQMLETLVREHSRLVYGIAYAVLRRHHDAEDATQETFMRVLRYSSKLAQVKEHKPWLARIAWRVAVDRSNRHSNREIPLDDTQALVAEPLSSEAAADEALGGAQMASALEKLIAALPVKLREPLILSTIQEISPREVAATLGISEATVRSRVFRARQILKEKLAQRVIRK